jgi:competence protein ComGF
MKNQNKGYTLISVLFSLSVFLIITPMLAPYIKLFIQLPVSSTLLAEQESVDLFFYFLQKEIAQSKHVEVKDNALYLTMANEEIIQFEKYNNLLRRRVNFTGHEVMLFNVSDFHVTKFTHSILVSILTTGGNDYEKILYTLSPQVPSK